MEREVIEQRYEESRVGDGEEKERGQTLGTSPKDNGNGRQDLVMRAYGGREVEVILEEGR